MHHRKRLPHAQGLRELPRRCRLRPGREGLGDPGCEEVEGRAEVLRVVRGVRERVEGVEGVSQGGELEGQRFGRLVEREVEGERVCLGEGTQRRRTQ